LGAALRCAFRPMLGSSVQPDASGDGASVSSPGALHGSHT